MKDREFCKKLKQLRERAGLTQAQLGNKAELPAAVICFYEIGERAPGLANLKAIIKGLGCSADELLNT
jgi:transcriptional regulator with XRE-family HTH domain